VSVVPGNHIGNMDFAKTPCFRATKGGTLQKEGDVKCVATERMVSDQGGRRAEEKRKQFQGWGALYVNNTIFQAFGLYGGGEKNDFARAAGDYQRRKGRLILNELIFAS